MSELDVSVPEESTSVSARPSEVSREPLARMALSDPLMHSTKPLQPRPGGGPIMRSGTGAVGTDPAASFSKAAGGASQGVPHQSHMEGLFGTSFGDVRVTTGRSEALGSMGADAAASGRSIAFADSSPSKELVGHELAHVVQQDQSSSTSIQPSGAVSDPNSAAEVEARSIGKQVAAGQSVTVQARPDKGIHRNREKAAELEHINRPSERALGGLSGAGGSLPFGERIQTSFGRHDISGVSAYTGPAARDAATSMGASAYAMGDSVAFKGTPDLHTTAHEAAHTVQQQGGVQLKGGVGQDGDRYEQNADHVADLVVAGQSAETALDTFAGGGGPAVQLDTTESDPPPDTQEWDWDEDDLEWVMYWGGEWWTAWLEGGSWCSRSESGAIEWWNGTDWAPATETVDEAGRTVKNKAAGTAKATGIFGGVLGRVRSRHATGAQDLLDDVEENAAEAELTETTDERSRKLDRAIASKDKLTVLRVLQGAPLGPTYDAAKRKAVLAALKALFKGKKEALVEACLTTGKIPLVIEIDLAGGDTNGVISAFESRTDAERQQFLATVKAPVHKDLHKSLDKRGLMKRFEKGYVDVAAIMAGPGDDATKRAGLKSAFKGALLARIDQRNKSDSWYNLPATKRKGVLGDIEAVAKEVKGIEALPGGDMDVFLEELATDADVAKAINKSIGGKTRGRQADKGLNLLKGGGVESIWAVLEDERKRMGTDDARIFKALENMSDADKAKLRDAAGAPTPAYNTAKEGLSKELSGSAFNKARSMLDGETGSVTTLATETLEHSGKAMRLFSIISDRTCINAVISMSGAERAQFRKDVHLQDKVKKGVSTSNWTKIQELAGLNQGEDLDGAGPKTQAQTDATKDAEERRLAQIIIDGLDQKMMTEKKMMRVVKALMQARKASEAGIANLATIKAKVDAAGVWTKSRWTGKKNKGILAEIQKFLAGTGGMSALQIAAQFAVNNKDATGMGELIGELPPLDLIKEWSNVLELEKRAKALSEAKLSQKPGLIKSAQSRVNSFVFDVDMSRPTVKDIEAATTKGFFSHKKEFQDLIDKARGIIISSSKADGGDAAVRAHLAQVAPGYAMDDLEQEKTKFATSQDAFDLRRRGKSGFGKASRGLADTFSDSGTQVDLAGAGQVGVLRQGLQELGVGSQAERDDLADRAGKRRAHFESRLDSFEEMKAFAASIVTGIFSALVAVGLTIATGGLGVVGPFIAALITAAAGKPLQEGLNKLIKGDVHSVPWKDWQQWVHHTGVDLFVATAAHFATVGMSSAFSNATDLVKFGKGVKGGFGDSTFGVMMGSASQSAITAAPGALVKGFTSAGSDHFGEFLKSGEGDMASFSKRFGKKLGAIPEGVLVGALKASLTSTVGDGKKTTKDNDVLNQDGTMTAKVDTTFQSRGDQVSKGYADLAITRGVDIALVGAKKSAPGGELTRTDISTEAIKTGQAFATQGHKSSKMKDSHTGTGGSYKVNSHGVTQLDKTTAEVAQGKRDGAGAFGFLYDIQSWFEGLAKKTTAGPSWTPTSLERAKTAAEAALPGAEGDLTTASAAVAAAATAKTSAQAAHSAALAEQTAAASELAGLSADADTQTRADATARVSAADSSVTSTQSSLSTATTDYSSAVSAETQARTNVDTVQTSIDNATTLKGTTV